MSDPRNPRSEVSDPLEDGFRRHLERLYPICRSISGPGLRETLDIIAEDIELQRTRVPTGTEVFDWTIGDEWTIRQAFIATLDGERVVDFGRHNLHVVGYSTPVDAEMNITELDQHLHSLPDHPSWIPYRTSYYSRNWGFCLSQVQRDALTEPRYRVVIDSTLAPGALDFGEAVVPGELPDEVIFSAHVCHPSLANDNLTGIAVAMELAKHVMSLATRRYTYRFLFAPGTIGSLAWLKLNPESRKRIRSGLVLTGLGGPGDLLYKSTVRGDAYVDRAATRVVTQAGGTRREYSPWGYDERQFNAVGFGMPVGRLSRTPHGEYPEYHTSADNLEFVSIPKLVQAFGVLTDFVHILETDRLVTNLSPFGEPQLGKRGLYPSVGGQAASDAVMAMLWTLARADGEHSLLDIAELSDGCSYRQIHDAADQLQRGGLLATENSMPTS
jgi:aminopeptidase-like protein